MADGCQHAADLAFASLVYRQLQPACTAFAAQYAHTSRRGGKETAIVFSKSHTIAKLFQLVLCGTLMQECMIAFFQRVAWMRETQREIAIIGQQQESTGISVKATNRIDPQSA